MKTSTFQVLKSNLVIQSKLWSEHNKRRNKISSFFAYTLILFLFFFPKEVIAQNSTKFNIVFTASVFDSTNMLNARLNNVWLDTIQNSWGATGVCLRVVWADFETENNMFYWAQLDSAINLITRKGLDVYIRASMGSKPSWVKPGIYFTNNDFQTIKNINDSILLFDAIRINTGYDSTRQYPLNFCSNNSIKYLLRYFRNLVEHLKSKYPNIKEIVPSVTPDEEMEFPYNEMCGYSVPEINNFRKYLITKHGSINNINSIWGSTFADTVSIDPRNFNWHKTAPYNYVFPAGRMDWINWRTLLLKTFVDSCAQISHNYGYKIGLQLGSIYDALIAKRGWYDVTPLLENVDALHVADVCTYKPNFEFGADYARSICKYWEYRNNKKIEFTTESNWPEFIDSIPSGENDWILQLETYHNKGASAHYIFGWDRNDLPNLSTKLIRWKAALTNDSIKTKVSMLSSKVVHLGCEEGNYEGLNASGDSSYFLKSICPRSFYKNNKNNYDGDCDIVTNYMLSNSKTYLQNQLNYKNLYLTQSSKYISDEAYKCLMQNTLLIPICNATWYNNNGHGQFAITEGLRNEYNKYRSPIHLIWRGRSDLMQLFPDANEPDPIYANLINWDSSPQYDFIFWASTIGINEYPNWNLKQLYKVKTKSSFYYENDFAYDSNIRNLWELRSDLRDVFIDGHYNLNHDWNIIDWTKRFGYNENPDLLSGYQYWPFIGTQTSQEGKLASVKVISSIKDVSSIANTFNNTQTKLNLIEFYPNPIKQGQDIFYQTNSNEINIDLKIIDSFGKPLISKTLKKNEEFKVNTSNLSKGIYLFKVDGQKTYKIIVE